MSVKLVEKYSWLGQAPLEQARVVKNVVTKLEGSHLIPDNSKKEISHLMLVRKCRIGYGKNLVKQDLEAIKSEEQGITNGREERVLFISMSKLTTKTPHRRI